MLIYLQTIETEEDKSKFEDIYREYRGLMYYVAYKRLHHEQDAEDAVHYAFMKIAENIKIIDPVSPKTKQLVVTIVDNRVTDMLRMNGRHPTAEYNDEILNQLSAELHTDDLLTEAILKLPEQQRHVISEIRYLILRRIAIKIRGNKTQIALPVFMLAGR